VIRDAIVFSLLLLLL